MSSSPKKRTPQRPPRPTSHPTPTHANHGLVAAIAIACFGTPLAVALWSTGNRFGPVKATLLAAAATLALAMLARDPDAPARLRALCIRSWVALGALALVLIALAAALFGRAPGGGILGTYSDFRGVAMLLACVGVLLATGVAAQYDDLLARLWWPLHAGTAIILAGAMLQRFEVLPGAFELAFETPRVFSTAGNSSNLGVLLVLLVPFLLASGVRPHSRWRRQASLALSVAALPVLLWTSSRGALLGAAAAALVWAVLERRRIAPAFRDHRVVLATAGVAALLVMVAVLTPGTIDRLGSLLDTQGRSAQIRLKTWAAAADAIAARPLAGSGAGSFRVVFPAHMRPGTIDGIEGPQVVEAAHNVVLDAGVSFGLLGLAAAGFALFGAARAAWRRPPHDERRHAFTAAAAALAGGFVALNFHYITLDTAPLIALAFGLLAAAEVAQPAATNDAPPTHDGRLALGAAAVVLAMVTALYSLTAVADVSYARGLGLAASGAPWGAVRGPLIRATTLAPWEPRFAEGVGTAAAIVVSKRFDEQVYAEGRAGFARTLALKPGDAYALGGDANLVLLAANLGRQKQLYPEALARHEEAAAADPANGTPLVGVGSCLAGLGRWDEAAATYERALELSPRYVLAWDNLALAYDRLGRSADAAEAKARADSLRKASR